MIEGWSWGWTNNGDVSANCCVRACMSDIGGRAGSGLKEMSKGQVFGSNGR